MSSTLVRKSQIRPLNIVRSDINTTTSGSALITKIIAGTGLTLSSSTGVNPGTGDVTVALSIATASTLGGVKIGSGLSVAVDGTISVNSISTTWGTITGLLSNQTDLQAALNAKYNIPTGTSSQYIDGTGALQTFPSALATGYVRHEVKAGVPIIKGQAVYVRSSDGTNMIVELASYDTEQTSSKTMGLLDRTVSTNGFANVITEGLLAGLDTTAAQAGDPVWLGPNGNLLYGIANKPHAPFHMVFIGIVTRVNANNGEIFVKVQNGYELDEIHDVLISGAVAGQLLRRDSDGLWKNWTPNYLTSFTETDPTVPAHVKAITTTNISNWNTAYSWGNHATQGYLTSVTNISGYAGTLLREDNRTISPSELAAGQMKFGFTSWNNNNTSPYADFIHMRSYTDASGGTDNLIMFLKNGIGMRIWQQSWGSTNAYAEYVDVWTTGNFTQTNVNNWNTAYSWGNHGSQGYATQSYVNTAISNLVDAAPGALDTLNELAAALGDDPNFATTVTNNIATKVSKSGDTMTGNLNWAQTDRGITWGFNTDGAYIKFFNTGDGDPDSRLEYATSDNGDEYHRWMISGSEEMTLRFDGLRVRDSIWMGGNLVATQSWVGSQGYITGYTESDPTVPAHVKAITTTNISNWNTAYGWGNHSGLYIPINPDNDGPSWTYSDENPTINGTYIGGRQSFGADGDALTGGALQARLLNAYDGHVNSAYGYYVGNLNYGGDSGTHTTTQVIDSSGKWVGPSIGDSYISSASNWNTAFNWGNHASAGYLTSLPSHTHDDRYLPIGGGWYGVNLPGSRWGGYAVNGGEIVFGRDIPNTSQMSILVDGAYLAGENNGFWSLPSDNNWNGRRGMSWNGSYLDFTTNSPTAQFTNLRLANGFEIQQGGADYGRFSSWVHLNGHYGFYASLNGAHLYPNNGSYGSWRMDGSRNGWQGIEFGSGGAGAVSLMIQTDSNTSGFHNNSYGWQIKWSNGTLYVGKNSYGGGTEATVLDSSNYTSYAATSNHTHDLMRYSLRAPGNVDSLTSSNFRDQLFGTSSNGWTISTARWNSVPSGLSGMNMYGTMFAWSGSDTHGFIATDYSTANIQVGGGSGNAITWKATLIHSSNIGSQSVSYATTAGALSSMNISQFTNNSGYITASALGSYLPLSGGTLTGDLLTNSAIAFRDGSGAFTNIIRAAGYPSEGYSSSDKYWMEYRAFGGHHFVLNVDGGVGSGSNTMDDFVIWQGAIDGDRLLELSNTGNLTVRGAFTEQSSLRYKENIINLESISEKVEKLRPVRYNKIGNTTTEIGLIAEEVAEVFPEFVNYNANGQVESLNYTRLSVALLQTVKELSDKINKLERN